MSKLIEVHRHSNLVEMSQEDPEVKAWLGEAYKPIGPYMEGKVTATGLTFEEQRILLPEYLGIEPTDKDFRRTVNTFYDNFIYKIERDGTKLEIGLEDDSKELSPTNMPLVLLDYLKYRHLVGHPHVAMSKEEAEKGYMKRFYIHDPNKVAASAMSINTLEDKAMSLYMKYKDDAIKIDQILTVLGKNVHTLKKDKILVLKDLSQKNPKLGAVQQKEAFKQFISVCEDADLEVKFLIEEGIAIQYLRRVGASGSILISETGKVIADNMEEAVLYFKNPKHSRELNLLKAEYETKMKKGKRFVALEETKETKMKKGKRFVALEETKETADEVE